MEMSRTRDRITVGKAHAFDMGYTADELKTAWDTVKKTNVLGRVCKPLIEAR